GVSTFLLYLLDSAATPWGGGINSRNRVARCIYILYLVNLMTAFHA
ncbi:unnamed protein product, partial [Amoebophrya sp. A25]